MTLDLSNTVNQRRGTWHSYDAPYERLRVFSPLTIGGFGLAVCLGLVLAYPHQTLGERLALSEGFGAADRLTVEYLKVFLKAQPSAQDLRISLVRQLVNMDAFDEAREALAPLHVAAEPAIKLEAAWQELRILEKEAFADPAGTASRAERVTRMRILLLALIQLEQTDDNLLLLAKKALATEDQSIALAAYQRLAIQAHTLPADQFAEGARFALGLGDYKTSSLLLLKAMQRTRNLDIRRTYFLDALRALQAVGMLNEAIVVADANLGPLSDDHATLMFLTRLARAANRPTDAERYAKRMLQMSWLQPEPWSAASSLLHQRPMEYAIAQWQSHGVAALRQVAGSASSSTSGPSLPFEEESYQLAFDVFLANRNLQDARRLAQAAVAQRPGLIVWRKRLAELSEWMGDMPLALESWMAYARASNDDAGWEAVLRLSKGLGALPAMQEALRYKMTREPASERWFDELVASHEAAGEAEKALQLVRARVGSAHSAGRPAARADLLRLYSDIALRAGSKEELEHALRLAEAEPDSGSDPVLRLAGHLSSQGKLADAFMVLQRSTAKISSKDTPFWRTYAELAQRLQENDAAKGAYLGLLASGDQSELDQENLIGLLEPIQPRAAAMVAEYAFMQSGSVRLALQALFLHMRSMDWHEAQRLLKQLPSAALVELERNADFLSARASLNQTSGRIEQAQKDYKTALSLRPDDSTLRAAVLWNTIALRDRAELTRLLGIWAVEAKSDSAMWAPFAAAHMALNQQDIALHWFRRAGFLSNDYLWLMAYAECLDANSMPELAWRIRRKAWLDLRRPDVLQEINPAQWREMRDRLAVLAPIFAEGDGARAIIQALLRADIEDLKKSGSSAVLEKRADGKTLVERIASLHKTAGSKAKTATVSSLFTAGEGMRPEDDASLSAPARELALAYALNQNAHDLARAWLAARFAQQLAKPLWAQLSLALSTDDRDSIRTLLDTSADWLPMYDRIEAAQRTGHPALAQGMTFDQLTRLPHDEELHRRMTSFVNPDGAVIRPSLTLETATLQQRPLDIRRTGVHVAMRVTNGLTLAISTTLRSQTNTDRAQLGAVPRRDDEVALALQARMPDGYVALQVHQRHAATSTTGLRLDYRLSPAPDLSINLIASLRERTNESAVLRTGGMRTGLELSTTYAVSSHEYMSAGLSWQRYASQGGTLLGSGLRVNTEGGVHFRSEYPNLTMRLFAAQTWYRSSNGFDAQIGRVAPPTLDPRTFPFLPDGSRTVGFALGMGTVAENRYSRAWRPFAEIGLLADSEAGNSPTLRGGLVGSLLGQDIVSLQMQQTGGTSANPEGLREFGLHYQRLY